MPERAGDDILNWLNICNLHRVLYLIFSEKPSAVNVAFYGLVGFVEMPGQKPLDFFGMAFALQCHQIPVQLLYFAPGQLYQYPLPLTLHVRGTARGDNPVFYVVKLRYHFNMSGSGVSSIAR